MRPLTVAYVGNFVPPSSTENQVAWTLEAMGHEVLRLQENHTRWDVVTHVAKSADLLLWTTTSLEDHEGASQCLKALDSAGVPSVAFHLDLWFGIKREVQVVTHPFFRCAYVITADGGHPERFAALGVNHHWMPPAIYAPDAICGTPTEDYSRFPIVFVGSFPYPHQEHAAQRSELIRFLQTYYGAKHRLYRSGVRGSKLADLYASAVVAMGDSCLAGKVRNYWSDRIPETVGRGCLIIHPYVPGIEDHYTDGFHLRTYDVGDWSTLKMMTDHYLANPEDARSIGLAGQAHVRQHHTYTNRMQSVIELVLG